MCIIKNIEKKMGASGHTPFRSLAKNSRGKGKSYKNEESGDWWSVIVSEIGLWCNAKDSRFQEIL